ncbi:MAG: hypothetical protein ACP5H3_04010, partial [Candidatus Aenigmatarchaeota archaeon]
MKKDYYYFEKKYGKRFYQLGYGMASGKKGTGWMKFDPEEFNNINIEEDEDAIEYAEGWLETDQWNYEVGELIKKIAEKEGIEEGTDSFHYDVFEP